MRYRGQIYIIGSLILGVGALLFSLAPTYVLALPALLFAGLGQSGFTTMQTTIATTASTPEMRGRAMGAVAMVIGSLPLGMLYMGGLAEWIGAPRAVTYSSIAFLGVVLLTAATQPGFGRCGEERESGDATSWRCVGHPPLDPSSAFRHSGSSTGGCSIYDRVNSPAPESSDRFCRFLCYSFMWTRLRA